MPCSQPARGTKDGGTTSPLPFNDVINNNPCGEKILVSIDAVPTSQTVCLFHYMARNGAIPNVNPVYVFGA
jgi:hypothetical protein